MIRTLALGILLASGMAAVALSVGDSRAVSKCCLDPSRKCTQCPEQCCPDTRDCCCRHNDKCTCDPTSSAEELARR